MVVGVGGCYHEQLKFCPTRSEVSMRKRMSRLCFFEFDKKKGKSKLRAQFHMINILYTHFTLKLKLTEKLNVIHMKYS